jgi:hypothetical protein
MDRPGSDPHLRLVCIDSSPTVLQRCRRRNPEVRAHQPTGPRPDRAIRTKITHRDVLERCLAALIGELRIEDVRVSGLHRVIREIRERRGQESARHSMIVLSGSFGMAVRHDALDANPVRERPGRTRTCGLAIIGSDYRTVPIMPGTSLVCSADASVGAEWYWTLAAVPGR